MRLGIAVLVLALSGCGGGDDSKAGSTGGAAGASGSGGAAGSGGSGGSSGASGSGGSAGQAPCSEDPSTLPPGSVCVLEVKGRVIDATDAPVAGLSVSVCGAVCWYGESDATGAFTVVVGAQIPPEKYSTLPHGRPNRANFYYPLPAVTSTNVDVGDLTVVDLPPAGPPLVVWSDKAGAPAQTLVADDVTLDVPQGVQVKLDVEDVALADEGKMFRALTIPTALMQRFVPPSLGITQLYAFTPFEAAIVEEGTGNSASAKISVNNTTGLAAGSPVEFLALGSYLFADWVKPAAFEVVATGSVSQDAQRIEMDSGQGVRYLTWLGVRPKP